jgi:formate dehydrogenase assembly factor FdhD
VGSLNTAVRSLEIAAQLVSGDEDALFHLLDAIETRCPPHAQLCRVVVSAQMSEGPGSAAFHLHWNDVGRPKSVDALMGRMLSYAFRLRQRGITLVDHSGWTVNGTRVENSA